MKKLVTLILALIYLGSSTGATVHLHYCMGKLADWGLGHQQSESCGTCGMDQSSSEDSGCCKDEHKFIKSDPDQKLVEAGLQLMQLAAVSISLDHFMIPAPAITVLAEEQPVSNAPPRKNTPDLYLLNRAFLI